MIKSLTEDQIMEQFAALKAMTVRTGMLHEAQTLQIQMWPLVAFPFAMSSVAEIDTTTHKVLFKITTSLDDDPKGKSNDRAKDFVVKWVRNILWDDTQVLFRFDNHGTKKRNSRSRIVGRRSKNSK